MNIDWAFIAKSEQRETTVAGSLVNELWVRLMRYLRLMWVGLLHGSVANEDATLVSHKLNSKCYQERV